MPTKTEQEKLQAEILFDLLEIQAENRDVEIVGLSKKIARLESGMSKEAIAWVETQIKKIYG
ncbi:MAG: hypothetical protein FWF59_00185 [Turicibacter sp.]|nr:hypothetical protein [Turicibacter sp.]